MSETNKLNGKEQCFALLKDNPEWLTDDDLLLLLPWKDPREGVASLLERQATLLRKENETLQKTLQSFYDEAKHNEQLLDGLKNVSLGLVKVSSLSSLVASIPELFEQDFQIDKAVVCLHDLNPLPDIVQLPQDAIDGFYLGESQDAWNQALFGGETIRSVAIVALQAEDEVQGYLFLGSCQASTFIGHLSTDFLDWAGALLSEKVAALS